MFCPNCGKKVNDFDNFCKFCGHDLRESRTESYIESEQIRQETFCMPEAEERNSIVSVKQIEPEEIIKKDEKIDENDNEYDEENEIVVFEIKKHYMSMFWPCVFSPIFIAYFWIFYVNIPSFLGFIIALIFLAPIIYPILRYYSDRSVITTSNLHIRQGVFIVDDICVPLKKIHLVRLRRSFLGRLANYGHLIIEKENSDKEIVYRYIQNPDDVQFVLNNSKAYIREYFQKDKTDILKNE